MGSTIKIQSAASGLVQKFHEEPGLLIGATLLTIDCEVHEDDALFVLVEELVINEWPTLRNKHPNRPRELLRSVIIDALKNMIEENPEAAGIVWNTAASPIKHGQAKLGKADPIVTQLIEKANCIVETEAVKRATLPLPVKKKKKRRKISSESEPLQLNGNIKSDDILQSITCAVAPQYPAGTVLSEANPHWPNTAGTPWPSEFIPRMSEAVANAVSLGNKKLAKSLEENLSAHLEDFAKRTTEQVEQTQQIRNEKAESRDTTRMKLDVLWWSEALYSPSKRCSYRDLKIPSAAVFAACDLTDIAPALSPTSVSYVLGETLYKLSRIMKSKGQKKLGGYLSQLAVEKHDLRNAWAQIKIFSTRCSLLEIVEETQEGMNPSTQELQMRTGVDPNIPLSPGEFAMWLFRDIQARRLVEVLNESKM